MQKIVLDSNARQPEKSYEGYSDSGSMLVDVIILFPFKKLNSLSFL